MFNSKTDICNSEWIELVFENRNKSYGAYDLRKHSADNMNRALAIMLFLLVAIIATALFMNPKPASVAVNRSVDFTNKLFHFIPEATEQTTAHHQDAAQPEHQNIHHHINTQPAVVNGTTHTVPAALPLVAPAQAIVPAVSIPVGIDNTATANNQVVINDDELDVKPIFAGGAQEWARFLEMNLRYPAEARQGKISGIVWISFVVERNGQLSNIVIDRPAGHGFDEEAMRVLKQSPVWTPTQQNGQAVRVKYSLPINFHMVR